MGDRSYDFDSSLQLSDGASSYTTDQTATVGGSAAILDLMGGSSLQSFQPVTECPRFEGICVLQVSAVSTSTGNAVRVTLQGSNDAAFGAGTCQNLASMDFGNSNARDGQASSAMTTATPAVFASLGGGQLGSMYEMPFVNQQAGQGFRYIRLWVDVIASGTITLVAYVAPVSW